MNNLLPPKMQRLMELQGHADPTAFWGSRDMYLIFSAILLVVMLVFVWAIYVRKRRHRKRTRYDLPREISRAPKERNRKRKLRWKNRNPTLSQTGGLPPARDERAISDSE